MGGAAGFVFALDEELCGDDLVAMVIGTPQGRSVQIWAAVELVGRTAVLRQFAIYGLDAVAGELGWPLLRRMAQAAMEEFDVDCIRIADARRTTGPRRGRSIKPLEFRRHANEPGPKGRGSRR